MWKLWIILPIFGLACSKAQSPVAPEPNGAEGPPRLEFAVLADTVTFGEAVPIEWNATGHQVVIDQGVGTRGPVGSEEVPLMNPGKKIFTATAYGRDNQFVVKQDSVFVKEAPEPILPVIMLSVTKKVTVNQPATITWHSQNAEHVAIDYVENPMLQGSSQVTFSTPGMRIVKATAFNEAGYTTAADTVNIIVPDDDDDGDDVDPVDDILVAGDGHVRADQGESGYSDRDVVTFDVTTAGKYQVFAEVWYNSGDSQRNESFYIQIRSQSGVETAPQNPNAGVFRVVPDDPGAPHTSSRASGVFNLTAGVHSIDLYHYAKIAHIYPQFVNGEISGPESVKIVGFRLEYVD